MATRRPSCSPPWLATRRAWRARPLLPFEAVLGPAPTTLVAGPGGVNPRRVSAALVFTGSSRVDPGRPRRASWPEARRAPCSACSGTSAGGAGSPAAAPPLGWERGQAARWTPGDLWVFETTDLLEDVLAWKPLVDDQARPPGPDLRVRRGETRTITFP